MANQIKISFIIPVYNGGSVLARSVDSILHDASIGSVEVIIVENGSKDDTTQVAENLSEHYNVNRSSDDNELIKLVRLYHSEKGVSNARNIGIAEASGEWIAFLDADDQISPDGIHLMILDAMTSKADMIVYSHMAGVSRRGVVSGPIEYYTYGEDRLESMRVRMISNPTRYMQAWGKLFRTEVIKRHNVQFNPEISLSEDSDFVLKFTRYCRQIDFSSAVVYRYSVDIPSTIRVYDGSKADRFAVALESTAKAVECESPAIRKAFSQYVLMNMNVVMVREVWEASNPHTKEEKMAEQKRVVKLPVFENALKSTSILKCRSGRMLPVLCFKLHWHKLAAVIYRKRVSDNLKLSKRSGEANKREK